MTGHKSGMDCPGCSTETVARTMLPFEVETEGIRNAFQPSRLDIQGYLCGGCGLSIIDLDASDFNGALWTNKRQPETEEQEPLMQRVLWLKGAERENETK